MKHPANREFFAYWDEQRSGAAAPERGDLAPEAVRHLLGDIFVLSYDADDGHPFRVAGTRLCALFGRDLKGRSFTALFGPDSRQEIEDIVGIVAEETLATVAGITAQTEAGTPAHLELLLLPFSTRLHTPLSLTGLLAPLGATRDRMPCGTLTDLSLTSWRHIGQQPRGPRMVRRWSVIRGLTVYEGLR
jgi:hypothetical protein